MSNLTWSQPARAPLRSAKRGARARVRVRRHVRLRFVSRALTVEFAKIRVEGHNNIPTFFSRPPEEHAVEPAAPRLGTSHDLKPGCGDFLYHRFFRGAVPSPAL